MLWSNGKKDFAILGTHTPGVVSCKTNYGYCMLIKKTTSFSLVTMVRDLLCFEQVRLPKAPGSLSKAHGTMNSLKYQNILNKHLMASTSKLRIVHPFIVIEGFPN